MALQTQYNIPKCNIQSEKFRMILYRALQVYKLLFNDKSMCLETDKYSAETV